MSKAFATNPRAAATGPRAKAAKSVPSKSAPRRKATQGNPLTKALNTLLGRDENKSTAPEETACIPEAAVVTSLSETEPAATSASANNEPGEAPAPSPASPARSHKMQITLNRSTATRKDERLVIFEYADGRAGQVQFLRSAFPEAIPDTITMEGDFAERVVKTPKTKLTKEERAALPKPTLAEKLQAAEARAQKLRDKLAKDAANAAVAATV